MTTQLNDKGRMDIALKLERDQAGHYRFTEYEASLYRDGQLQRRYTFPAESRITAIEAANLLEGRPVSKSYQTADGSFSQKWVQLDFQGTEPKPLEFHADYGYDLRKELMAAASGLGVEGLGRDKIVKDLEAGKLIGVEIPGKGPHYLHANPADRSLSVWNADKKPVELAALVRDIHESRAALRQIIALQKIPQRQQVPDYNLGIGI